MTKLTAYITGFVFSIVLTLVPVGLLFVYHSGEQTLLSPAILYGAFVLFAVLQLLVQLTFFLHMDQEARPRLTLMTLCFALLVVAILVGGTLWIMDNLSYGHEEHQPFIEGVITPATSND